MWGACLVSGEDLAALKKLPASEKQLNPTTTAAATTTMCTQSDMVVWALPQECRILCSAFAALRML